MNICIGKQRYTYPNQHVLGSLINNDIISLITDMPVGGK